MYSRIFFSEMENNETIVDQNTKIHSKLKVHVSTPG